MIRRKICRVLLVMMVGVCVALSIFENSAMKIVYAKQVRVIDTHNEITEEVSEVQTVEKILSTEPVVGKEAEVKTEEEKETSFSVLTPLGGVNEGPSGSETYYNLNMDGVVWIMRNCGFSEEDYPYWVRDDGVKMFGDYVMVAADLSIRPRGSLIECSLGMAIVCDTGDFIYENPYHLDVAVDW